MILMYIFLMGTSKHCFVWKWKSFQGLQRSRSWPVTRFQNCNRFQNPDHGPDHGSICRFYKSNLQKIIFKFGVLFTQLRGWSTVSSTLLWSTLNLINMRLYLWFVWNTFNFRSWLAITAWDSIWKRKTFDFQWFSNHIMRLQFCDLCGKTFHFQSW